MKCSLEDSNETSESISVVQPLTAQQTATVDTVAKLESNSVVNTVLCDSSGDPTNENTSTSPTPSTHHRSGLSKFRFSKNKLTKVHLLLIYSIFLTFIVMFSILVWFLKDVFPLKNLVVTNDENRGGCVPMKVQYCIKHHVLYPFIMLPKDSNRSANQDMLSSKLADYDAILSVNCYSLLPLFLCSLLTPFCDANNQPVKPCRSFCKEAIRRCDFFLRVFSLEWPTQVDCDQYPDDPDPFICVGYRDNERYLKRNRVCNTDGFRCDGNRCLPQSWICDGFLDCKDKSDESNCSTCAAHQLYCGNGKCIDKSDICDGTRDCPDSHDERNCLRLRDSMGQNGEGRLEAWSAVDESWHNVCGEKWDQNFMSLKACRMLGYKHVKDTRIQDMSSTRLTSRISVNGRNSESKVMFYKGRERGCQKESNLSVYLRCTNFECGRSAINLNSNLRIVGGSESKPGQWPWLAGLHGGPAEVFFCGGVLISQRWVLSAAHCIGNQSDFSELTVKLGLTRRTSSPLFVRLYKVSQVIKHEGFNASNSYTNDIALLLLNESVNFDEFLKPVCLPNNEEDLKPGVECTVIGWGKSKHDKEADYLNVIHEVNVPLVNHSLCAQWYKLQDYTINEQMMLCAGYPEGKKDACQGDSGGPLLCRNSDQSWYVAGIVSWGVNCAQPELPGVYTNVKMYQEWIETVAQENGYPLSG